MGNICYVLSKVDLFRHFLTQDSVPAGLSHPLTINGSCLVWQTCVCVCGGGMIQTLYLQLVPKMYLCFPWDFSIYKWTYLSEVHRLDDLKSQPMKQNYHQQAAVKTFY